MVEINLDYHPQPRQLKLHSTAARQIFYGGAAGGGKSHGLRWDCTVLCLRNPGLQAYLFRKTLPELEDNHIKFLKREIPPELGLWNETRKEMGFFNGSSLRCCYAERDGDIYRYLGAEMHVCALDEASRMTEMQINFLRTRNRLGGFKPNPAYAHALPRFLMASNPGGEAHDFLKRTFVTAGPPETVFYDKSMRDPSNPKDKGWTSIYIPARIADNAYIDENYAASFSGLPPELARAYREGDWDAVVGQALHTLTRERHMVRQFQPPRHWTRFLALDWGTAVPFYAAWLCVSDGATLAAKENWPDVYLPAGAVILYDEWYGWNGRANQGSRMDSPTVAREIIHRERSRSETMDYRVGDTSMWTQTDGPCVAERMKQAEPTLVLRQAKKDREHNYAEFLARLAGNPTFMENGTVEDHPMFFATANCTHFWRTVPTLVLDDVNPEKGPDTRLEDHCYDAVAYGLRSRPYVMTEESRYEIQYGADIRRARRRNVDPYATSYNLRN